MNGDEKMKRLTKQSSYWVWGGILFLTTGCLGPAHSVSQSSTMPLPSQQNTVMREARAESQQLRAELASLKIAMAKQTADLQTAQAAIAVLRQKETHLGSKVQETKDRANAIQQERDQLRRRNAELQARSAAFPDIQQLLGEIRTMHTSFQQVVSTMKTLGADIIQIKEDMRHNQRTVQEQTAKLTAFNVTTHQPTQTVSKSLKPITIQPGDTLWAISRAYKIPVKQLKKLNGLTSNLLVVGQRLTVPFAERIRSPKNSGPARKRDASQPSDEKP